MMSGSKNNIQFNYLYRDGANYKVFGYEVFSNPNSLSLEFVENEIRKSLIDGEFFDPSYWKVRRLKHDDWILEIDHTWNEFESLEFSEETPTINIAIDEFLEMISKIPKYWL